MLDIVSAFGKFSHCFLLGGLVIFSSHVSFAGDFTTGQKANLVLGQPNFTSSASGGTSYGASGPDGVAIDPVSHKVFVAQSGVNAVYRYGSAEALTTGAPAEAILGQPGFGVTSPEASASKMNGPRDVVVDQQGRLWVSDSGNNRVLRFDNAAAKPSGADADGVLGQSNFTSVTYASYSTCLPDKFRTPYGIFVDYLGNLWVADHGNNRIVRFAAADLSTDGAAATLFIGAPNGFLLMGGGAPSAQRFSGVSDVTAGPNGEIYISDTEFYRIVRFDRGVFLANGTVDPQASGVIGQRDLNTFDQSSTAGILAGVGSLVVDRTGALYATQSAQARVAVFKNAASISGGVTPSIALGQSSVNNGWLKNAQPDSLYEPRGLAIDPSGNLWVTDFHDNRVLRYAPGEVPTVKVTGKKRLRTQSSSVLLRGKLSGASGTKVYVQNGDKGKAKPAKGAPSWKFRAPIKIGKNRLKIYAMDGEGRRSATIVVVATRY